MEIYVLECLEYVTVKMREYMMVFLVPQDENIAVHQMQSSVRWQTSCSEGYVQQAYTYEDPSDLDFNNNDIINMPKFNGKCYNDKNKSHNIQNFPD